MKHEVKDEKAGSGFVNDVEKGDDFVATDAETVKVEKSLSKGDTADNRVVQDKMVSKEDTSNDNQVSLEKSNGDGD
ncbi:hypothetical protein D5086_000115 [Populus alba]|uniref:Uncharacterized protein n=1 Tax=Populus alba TaxID=43335 RepID=A0ACC4CV44_POPAL